MPAPRKPAPPPTSLPSQVLDLLTPSSPAPATPARKSKRDGSPTWCQSHPAHRYDLTDKEVYFAVSGLATALRVNNISAVAAVLVDFALAMYDEGKVPMDAQVNPNGRSSRMVLTWERADGWSQEVKPDRNRKQRQKLISAPRERKASGWFRWSSETHQRISKIARQYDVSLGAIVTRLLEYAIDEYRAGHLKINAQLVSVREVSGWSAE